MVRAIDSNLHMDYTAVGQTTHLAARLEQMAKPGSVLTTGEILRLAEGFVQVRALGPVSVKGLADPVEVFELVGASSARTRLQALATPGLTRFVGRQAECQVLRQALERAGTRHGQVVAVIGEPGVGKTRPRNAASAPSRPSRACCCARARCSRYSWCSRTCTGSIPRPRRSSTA